MTDFAILTDTQSLAQAYPKAVLSAIYKHMPQDFVVEEILTLDFSGSGEHLWIYVQKQGMNTNFVAKQLAKWANIPLKDVGFSGLKDRYAVTSQWFSLRLPKKQAPNTPFFYQNSQGQSVEWAKVIRQHWHHKKLNRGTHQTNHFVIRLKEVQGNLQQIDKLLTLIKAQGVPNYFGEQRFGREGQNLSKALAFLTLDAASQKKQATKKHKEQISLLLSTARSTIFNQILSQRVTDGSWLTGLDGEVLNLAGSHSIFYAECLDESLKKRIKENDIYPTASLWGVREDKLKADSPRERVEQATICQNDVLKTLALGLEQYGIKAMQRPLKLLPTNFNWQWQMTADNPELILSFSLPAGSFATSVLLALGQIVSIDIDRVDDDKKSAVL